MEGRRGRHVLMLATARFRDMPRARIASDNTTELTKEEPPEMPPKALTPEHKQAMTAGRIEGQAVKAYLDALEQHRPKRGRKRTAESIAKRLAAIESELAGTSSLQRLQLLQERRDLQSEQAQMGGNSTDLGALESAFVQV